MFSLVCIQKGCSSGYSRVFYLSKRQCLTVESAKSTRNTFLLLSRAAFTQFMNQPSLTIKGKFQAKTLFKTMDWQFSFLCFQC